MIPENYQTGIFPVSEAWFEYAILTFASKNSWDFWCDKPGECFISSHVGIVS